MSFKIQISDSKSIFERPTKNLSDLESVVNEVFDEVKKNGDKALAKYTQKFDKVELSDFKVPEKEIQEAEQLLSEELKQAIQLAKSNIEKFHNSQKLEKKEIETTKGVVCWQESRGIEKVGIYIPGGTAPLLSTVLMLAVLQK